MSIDRIPAEELAELEAALRENVGPIVDGVPHAGPAIADLQRAAEQATIATPAAPTNAGLVRGSLWAIAGYAASQTIRLAGNILVSRLVLPEAFGIMAIVNILIQGLTMFSDIGIEPVLVQNRRGDEPRFYNTAWTVQVVRGFVLFFFAALLAWPISELYHEPRLLTLIPAAAATTILAGFYSTSLFAVRRHLLVARLTLLELASQVAGVGLMCALAFLQPDAWAMVAGVLTTAGVTLVGSHFLLPGYRNRFAWDPTAFNELFHFGKWVFVSTMITFCAMQIDRLMLGRLISIDQLGVYSVGLAVAMLPMLLLQTFSGSILYPLLARYARTSEQAFRENLAAARGVPLSLGLFCVTGVVLEAPTFFRVLYDDRYAAAGTIAQLLAVQVWVGVLCVTLERALQALADTRSLAAYNFVKLLASAAAATLGFYLAGLPGFILGYAAGAACGYLVLLARMREHGVSTWRDDLRGTALAGLAVILGFSIAQTGEAWGGPLGREIATWTYLAALGLRLQGEVRRLYAARSGA